SLERRRPRRAAGLHHLTLGYTAAVIGAETRSLLLEREAELEALETAVGAAGAGNGRFILIEGDAGTGKSELLAAARRQAPTHGVDVLSGRGSELEREVPFGIALELFGRPLQAVRPAARQALFRGAAELAAPLF